MTKKELNRGKVIIAGAGPGDPELITVKALKAIEQADVIIVDRLVSETLLGYARKNAVIIFAGKQGRNDQSISQQAINVLLAEHASSGSLVLRLKGGDVSLFSNLLDELEALTAYGIPYEIIPGITAASGAAAMAGIPLTARGHATAVRFLTAYKPQLISENTWHDLATTDDTLVFYMSGSTLDLLVGKLLDHHVSPEKHVAIVEQATTPAQRVDVVNLYEYEFRDKARKLASPALIIIGTVAKLHQQYQWLPNAVGGDYFRALAPRHNVATSQEHHITTSPRH